MGFDHAKRCSPRSGLQQVIARGFMSKPFRQKTEEFCPLVVGPL